MKLFEIASYSYADLSKRVHDEIAKMETTLSQDPSMHEELLGRMAGLIQKAQEQKEFDKYKELMKLRSRYQDAIDRKDWRGAATTAYDALQTSLPLDFMFASHGRNG